MLTPGLSEEGYRPKEWAVGKIKFGVCWEDNEKWKEAEKWETKTNVEK